MLDLHYTFLSIGEKPPCWEKMPVDAATGKEESVHKVDLAPGSHEYTIVESEFNKTMRKQSAPPATVPSSRASLHQHMLLAQHPLIGHSINASYYNNIVKIQRIQNPVQYGLYITKKREMDKRNPDGHLNERKLFHGTREDSCSKINRHSFNRSYAGQNGL